MTDDLSEVDTTEASQEASASVVSETGLLDADMEDGSPVFFMPVLDRIKTCD